jgi:hypothetical protein
MRQVLFYFLSVHSLNCHVRFKMTAAIKIQLLLKKKGDGSRAIFGSFCFVGSKLIKIIGANFFIKKKLRTDFSYMCLGTKRV